MKKFRNSPRFLRPLIWVLLTLAIAVVLAVVVLGTGGPIPEHRNRGETEIMAMEAGLESYKADNGDYPKGTNLNTSPTGNNALLLLALNGANGSSKVYLEFNKNQTNASGFVVDPFGNSYGYQYPGDPKRSGTNFFDLWSTGKDRSATNTNLWIKNW